MFFLMSLFFEKNKFRIFLLFLLLGSAAYSVLAGPVRKTEFVLMQPDGYSFKARLYGDEFLKILETSEGFPVIQEDDGFYYFAEYEADGSLLSTGCRVGCGQDANSGRMIQNVVPYDILYEKAAVSRAAEFSSASGIHASGDLSCIEKFAERYSGELRVPVLLVEFGDLKFKYTRDDFDLFLNKKGYDVNGATGSVKDYFDGQFSGLCSFSFEAVEIVSLDKPFSYYGRNQNSSEAGADIRVGRMVYDACRLADSHVDFSRYDNDKDGNLDWLLVVYAGGDEAAGAGSDHIWSKFGFISTSQTGVLNLDGVNISGFACTSELASDGADGDPIAGIGTFCHEFGHALGLPDLYDYNGHAECLWGRTSLMDRGNTNNFGRTPPNLNAIERNILGLVSPKPLSEGFHSMLPLNKGGVCYKYDTETEGEYFLFECRDQSGWDKYIGGSGMLIYHIDSSYNNIGGILACERWKMYGKGANSVNSVREHQCADLVEADPQVSFSGPGTPENVVSRVFYPLGETGSFTPVSNPPFKSWSGVVSDVSLTEIMYRDGELYFTVSRNEYSDIPFVRELKVVEFQDAAILTWNVDTDIPADVVLSAPGDKDKYFSVRPYSKGKFSITFEGLSPSTRYTVKIGYTVGDISGRVRIRNVSTHPASPLTPYIFLYGIERNRDGSFPSGTAFPLRLYNAFDAESVEWKMDGCPIRTGESGYYVPERSGMLEAVAKYKDGSEYRVSKQIIIR